MPENASPFFMDTIRLAKTKQANFHWKLACSYFQEWVYLPLMMRSVIMPSGEVIVTKYIPA